jgi:DnaJ-class molecular chaperone
MDGTVTWAPPHIAMKACEKCGATGRIPRTQRTRADGSLDALDILGQHMETCDKCGGSGEVPEKAIVVEPRKGYAADIITPLRPPIWA